MEDIQMAEEKVCRPKENSAEACAICDSRRPVIPKPAIAAAPAGGRPDGYHDPLSRTAGACAAGQQTDAGTAAAYDASACASL